VSVATSTAFQQQAQAKTLATALSQQDLIVVDRHDEIVTEAAPAPYTTADLLADAMPRYGWSGKQVMEIAQKLFESGWITYPRTDSQRLAPDAQAAIRDAVSAIYGADMLGKRDVGIVSTTIIDSGGSGNHSTTQVDVSVLDWVGERFPLPFSRKTTLKKQVVQKPPLENIPLRNLEDAHEAIRPTDPAQQPHGLGAPKQQVQLYTLIWQRTLASQMKPARYRRITVEMEITS
jgi:DNA topoisomerase I